MQLGRYTLQNLIGEGAYGQVWQGVLQGESGFSKSVAVKLIRQDLVREEEKVIALTHEALIGAQIKHPNVVEVHEFTRIEGRLLLVMELVDGETLSKVVAKHPRGLELEQVKGILHQIAAGLNHAHSLCDESGSSIGLIHRDLKPSNLMLDTNDTVKICDFGIAISSLSDRHTTTGTVRGSVGYMSPEQIRGLPLTSATDIWSLAVIGYELLTGQRLFGGKDPLNVSLQVNALVADAPAAELEHISPALAHLIRACLQKQPRRRPTAHQVMRSIGCSTVDEVEAVLTRSEQAPASALADTLDNASIQPVRRTEAYGAAAGEPHRSDGSGQSIGSEFVEDTIQTTQSPPGRRPGTAGILVALILVSLVWVFVSQRSPESTPTAITETDAGGVTDAGTDTDLQPATAVWTETRVTSSNWAQAVSGMAVSPDGTTVAYSLSTEREDRGIYLRPVEGGAPTKLAEGRWTVLDWFPRTERLLVAIDAEADLDFQRNQLGIMSLDGHFEPLDILANIAKISPDETRIAVAGNDGATIFFLDGRDPIVLEAGRTGKDGVQSLAWSPDGSHVAYMSHASVQGLGSHAIVVYEIATRQSLRLLEDEHLRRSTGSMELDWMEPDTLLYIRSQTNPNYSSSTWTSGPRNIRTELWALENASTQADGEAAKVIHSLPGVRVDHLTHAGSRIVLLKTQDLRDVWLLNLDEPSDRTQVTRDTLSDIPRFWLPDGRLVFDSARFGKNHLMSIRPGDTAPEVLLELPGPALIAPCGEQVDDRLFELDQIMLIHPPWDAPPTEVASSAILSTVAVDGTSLQERMRFEEAPILFSVGCSADGQKAMVGSHDLDALELRWVNQDDWTLGDPVQRIPRQANWALSPDGTMLAVAPRGEPPFVVDLDSGTRTNLDLPLGEPQNFAWSPDGETLILTGMFGREGASTYLVLKTDLEGDYEVLWSQDESWFSWPSVSPDGTQLAMLVWAFPQDIWMLNQTPL